MDRHKRVMHSYIRRIEANIKVEVADDPATVNEENMHSATVYRLV